LLLDIYFDRRISLTAKCRYWEELGIDAPCPIHFTEDELQSHLNDGEGWNEVQDFWDAVAGFVARDGWTHVDTYDNALALFSELRESSLKDLKGKVKGVFEEHTRWFDKST